MGVLRKRAIVHYHFIRAILRKLNIPLSVAVWLRFFLWVGMQWVTLRNNETWLAETIVSALYIVGSTPTQPNFMHPFGGAFFIVSPKHSGIKNLLVCNLSVSDADKVQSERENRKGVVLT